MNTSQHELNDKVKQQVLLIIENKTSSNTKIEGLLYNSRKHFNEVSCKYNEKMIAAEYDKTMDKSQVSFKTFSETNCFICNESWKFSKRVGGG